ncbi:MAG: SgcJ/EcaC family oxidoreductase [Ginsengibacter sp.]
MKKIMFITIVTLYNSSSLCAQINSLVAERFHSLATTYYSPRMGEIIESVDSFATAFAAQAYNKDEDVIHNIISTMQTGWNNKSGEKFASFFAETHDFVVWNGYYFRNTTKARTAAGHQVLFDNDFKTKDIELRVDKIKFIRPDVALVHVLGASYTKGQPVPSDPEVLMTLLLERKMINGKFYHFIILTLKHLKIRKQPCKAQCH